jgi:hypothetical protein
MNDKFRVIIAGGRDFDDFRFLCKKCMFKLQDKTNVVIVSGTAKGADQLGEKFAKFMGYEIKQFPANWDLGLVAGMLRNREMAEYADALIAFWDGKSKGTKNMIEEAQKRNLQVAIYYYNQEKEEDGKKNKQWFE